MKATIIARFKPTEFDTWRTFHHNQVALIRENGVLSDRICRDVTDPAQIVVINEVEDLDRFMAFMSSPEFQAMAGASPIEGAPEVMILEEIERPI